jgi:signal transduction histidine kinase/CheY-like chemotaxis protein/HPt (histidine-containing phosphotransfer) domain-containing protein
LFDGKTREKVPLPFQTYAVRGLARDHRRTLWVGAIGEIGHLERDPIGGWRYISARDELQKVGITDLRDVWLVQPTSDGVVFVADQQVLRRSETGFQKWNLPSSPRLLSNRDGDNLWIFQAGVGLLRMAADGPSLVLPLSELPSQIVFWAIVPGADRSWSPDSPLVIGSPDGVFMRESRRWTRLANISAAIGEKIPWYAERLDAQTFAVGSYLGGLIIASTHDEVLTRLDRASGLPHESVTGLWYDPAGQLWIGFPGGIARMEARGLASTFEPRNGLGDPSLKVLSHRGDTLVLSRRMLAKIEPGMHGGSASIHQLGQLQVPFSDALSLRGELWFSGYGGGVWRLDGHEPRAVAELPGYLFAIQDGTSKLDSLLLLRDTRLELLNLAPPAVTASVDLGGYPVNLVRGTDGDLWVSTVTNGVLRFRPDAVDGKDLFKLVRHFRAGNGLPENAERPRLATVGKQIYLFTEKNTLRYDSRSDAFNRAPEFGDFAVLAASPTGSADVAYWLVKYVAAGAAAPARPQLLRLNQASGSETVSWDSLDTPDLTHAGQITSLDFTDTDGGLLWVSGSQSLIRISVPHLSTSPIPTSLTLDRIERNDRPITLPSDGDTLVFDANTHTLRFQLAGVSRASGSALLVQGSLSGISDQWMKPQPDPIFVFTGLRPGVYTFRARPIDPSGSVGPTLTLGFRIAAPWYQGAPAIVSYCLVLALLVSAIVRWRLRRLRRQNERLNELVDARTRELARANLVKNEFLENISHEIRNPLNGIANLVDLLRDAPLPAEERQLAQSLGRSTEHLKRVFADVLGYTRLEYGHVQIAHAPFSMRQLLEDVIAMHGVEARELKTELSLHLPEGFADGFRGDAEKIRAILNNYVSNALKYARGAPVEVELRATPAPEVNRCRVWIGVRDHGPGVSVDEQARLFEKFSRGERARASGISGTGLGLATCRGLAELMDGQAGVSSEPGKGATFWVELSLELSPLPRPAPAAIAVAAGTRALIVDDQDYNQAVLRGIAQRLGFTADVASHAGEVWPLIETHTYAAVFLDWELPGLNGGEIARRLRRHSHTRDAIIIATTAHDTDDIRQQCLESQMDGFALKPFDTAKLQSILNAASSQRAGRAPNETNPDASESPVADSRLNLNAFRYFGEGNPARASEAVTLYVATLDQEIAALREAVAGDDREAVARRAHRVRSHASIVNGIALCAAAQQLVTNARNPAASDWRVYAAPVFAEATALRASVISLQSGSTVTG